MFSHSWEFMLKHHLALHVSSLSRGHANLLCAIPLPRRSMYWKMARAFWIELHMLGLIVVIFPFLIIILTRVTCVRVLLIRASICCVVRNRIIVVHIAIVVCVIVLTVPLILLICS